MSESLTCPVCFRQVETTDLYVFNTHIDQCLSDASRKPNQCTVSDSESDLDLENDPKECEMVEKCRRECEVEVERAESSEDSEVSRCDPGKDQHSSENQPGKSMVLLINSNSETVTSPQPQSCNDKGRVLICPICKLTQDSDDLTVFNHHVDLCLNQEVLYELGGQTSFPINPPSVINSKARDRSRLLPVQASTGKTKRRGSPSSPPSKKAKSLGPRNTIDKFFR